MARLSALFLLLAAAASSHNASGHEASSSTASPSNVQLLESRAFKQATHKSLQNCSASSAMRELQQRTHDKRREKWEQLQKERLQEASPVLDKSHKSSLTGITTPSDVDAKKLFGPSGNGGCVLEPDVTEGPFYVKGELIRNDLRESQAGIDLFTELQIIDVNTCEPVVGLYLDFWHCNSTGVYSGVVSPINGNPDDLTNLDTTFARGLAPTDKDGIVHFTTKFPGHYNGRTNHIHILGNHGGQLLENSTFVGTAVSNVGQLFFDQDLIKAVEATGVYATNTQQLTTNAEDGIFLEEASQGFDPIVEYVLLSDKVEDGIFAWISIGVDLKHTAKVFAASTYTANGGVANPHEFGPFGGNGDDDFPPFMQLNAASQAGANETNQTVAPVKKHHAPVVVEPAYHPVLAVILAVIVLFISNSATGGDATTSVAATSGVLVTVFSVVMGADIKPSIALALAAVTGTSVATFVDNVCESARDPAARSLIDWDLLLVVQPSLLLGVLIGIFVRGYLPSWLLSTVLATMLLVCGSLLLQSSHRRPVEEQHIGWSINEGSSLVQKPHNNTPAPHFNEAIQTAPVNKLGVLVGVVLAVAILQAALAVAVPVMMLLYLAYKSHETTVDTFERQQLPRVYPAEGEIKWTSHVVKVLPGFSALAGAVTSVFGFGSDIVLAPYLQEVGLDKAIATSTGAAVVLFASLLAALEGVLSGGVSFTLVVIVLLAGVAVKTWGNDLLARVLPASMRGEGFQLFVFALSTLAAGVALAIGSA